MEEYIVQWVVLLENVFRMLGYGEMATQEEELQELYQVAIEAKAAEGCVIIGEE